MKSIRILDAAGSFAENKDVARRIRETDILPAIHQNEEIEIDFEGVDLSTQSFIHALISQPLREGGEGALELILFKKCSDSVRGLIETVVQYVLETVEEG